MIFTFKKLKITFFLSDENVSYIKMDDFKTYFPNIVLRSGDMVVFGNDQEKTFIFYRGG